MSMPRPDSDGRLSGVAGGAVSECGVSIALNALLAIRRLPLNTPPASCRRSHFERSATLELAPPAGAWESAAPLELAPRPGPGAPASRTTFACQPLASLTCPNARLGESA